jgi:Fe-S cluster assembly scaffold protein SufB
VKKKAIVKKLPEGEVIPSTAMPKFEIALLKVQDHLARVQHLETEVRELKIVDQQSRIRGGELVAALKKEENDVEEILKPYKKVLKEVGDYIKKKGNSVYDLVEDLRKNVLNPRLGEWDQLEEKRAQAERDRVAREKQQALEREAEVQRQKDAAAAEERRKTRVEEIRADLRAKKITLRESEKLLREAGAIEEADKADAAVKEQEAKAKAAEIASRVDVAPNIPTQQGVVKRVNPKFRVVNPMQVKLKYLCPDEKAIGVVVRGATYETDADVKLIEDLIGGIEITFERTY